MTLDAFEKIDGDHHVTLAGNRNEKLDGSLSLDIGQNLDGKVGTKLAYDAGSEIHLKAGSTLVLESGTTLSLKVGGNFITIDPSGIAIKGTMVQINTGGAAGTGSGAQPTEATLPEEAGNSQGGDMPPPPTKVPPSAYSPQAQMFQMAAASGTPFCEVCNC